MAVPMVSMAKFHAVIFITNFLGKVSMWSIYQPVVGNGLTIVLEILKLLKGCINTKNKNYHLRLREASANKIN